MSRIEKVFSAMKKEDKKGLIPFITAGDPSLSLTLEVLKELSRAGADIIEVGIPYSDPMADGPVIQAASERAIESETSIAGILDMIRLFRKNHDTPLVLFGYYNPILQYGEERFAQEAAQAGADGCLVVDLPPEEAGHFAAVLAAQDMNFIALLTPTSDSSRIEAVKRVASGFVYYVSLKGVTGAASGGVYEGLGDRIEELRTALDLPIGVGFGISTPEDVRAVGEHADAVVVGSALIRHMDAETGSELEISTRAYDFLQSLRHAL